MGLRKGGRVKLQSFLQDIGAYLAGRRLVDGGPHIVVAALPKSGSTWLTQSLAALPGLTEAVLVPGYDRREQELDVTQLVLQHRRPWVAQMHLRYSAPTEKLLQQFGITPVVLVRDLRDVVASLVDHWEQESTAGPMAFLDERHARLPIEARALCAVDLVLPWYLNFVLSWQSCPSALWVTYEELLRDPSDVLCQIAARSGMAVSGQDVQAALATSERRATRKNVGTTGRGASLPPEALERIERLLSYYPGSDFGCVGFPGEPVAA